ncbi:MAG: hypothetical protein HZC54_19800 [Verrucomicrobia bacterium]|nr:hypothetical protein [Verrucomicrobiota bacterium]
MNARNLWSKILTVVGGLAVTVGAVDALEGSLLILPGAGLLALGTWLAGVERRAVASNTWAFVLVALGVGALWGLSALGGFGGTSGRSAWWGLLLLPYLIGWNLAVWGPGAPRWLTVLGIVNGLLFLGLAAIVLNPTPIKNLPTAIIVAVIGIVVIAGCIWRLMQQRKAKALTPAT